MYKTDWSGKEDCGEKETERERGECEVLVEDHQHLRLHASDTGGLAESLVGT